MDPSEKPDVTLRPAAPGEIESFIREQVPDQPLDWRPVGATWRQWQDKIGGWPTEQGTLLLVGDRVLLCGLCGTIAVGRRRPDGTIDASEVSIEDGDFDRDRDIIVAYADSPGCGYRRDERGAVIDDGEEL